MNASFSSRMISRAAALAMSGLAVFALSGVAVSSCHAQGPGLAASAGIRTIKDVPYVSGGHERQKLDLYLPAQGASRPLLVWIHGGGWTQGSKEGCPAVTMLGRGYAVASLNYRLSQHAVFPAQIEDCKAAIRWLRAHAAENGIDPARIAIWGASAGGHLAALLGVTGDTRQFDVGGNLEQSSRVQCVVDWFGPTDFLNWGERSLLKEPPQNTLELDGPGSLIFRLFGGRLLEHVEAVRAASPIYAVKRDAAPFLIMHGDKDPIVPLQQSESLHRALLKAGAESVMEVLPGAGHGGGGFNSPERLMRMAEFVESHLSASRSAALTAPVGAAVPVR